jgi:antitoxin component YwqK of YwqJK toxin-antitoxin module
MSRFATLLTMVSLAGCVSPGVRQIGLGDCQDGIRHGSYKLQVVDGPVVATGSFVDGRKHGVFTFYSTGGTKLAEIPYSNDAKSGTIRLWYSEFAYPGAAGTLKLEVEYTSNHADGRRRSWWPSGAKRSTELFRDGSLIQAEAWDEAGARLSRSQAEYLSRDSAQADAKYYRILESEIDAYLPACVRPAA